MKKADSFTLGVAGAGGAAEVSALLTASDLGAWDASEKDAEVIVARGDDGRLIGCAVLVALGDVGLLRSVAVANDQRGTGLGRALVEAVLKGRTARRLASVYLLTTTAAGFFAKSGFRIIEREAVDSVIKETRQYRQECPSTAVVMKWVPAVNR